MRLTRSISADGSWGTPTAAKGNGHAALGGVAWLILCALLAGVIVFCTGCADAGQRFDDVRASAYFPETFSAIGTVGHDDDKGWDRETVGGSLTWRLKPRIVVPVAAPTPKPGRVRKVVPPAKPALLLQR